MNASFSRALRVCLVAIATSLTLANCSSPSGPADRRPAPSAPPVQPMAGSAEFFSATVLAEVSLAPLRLERRRDGRVARGSKRMQSFGGPLDGGPMDDADMESKRRGPPPGMRRAGGDGGGLLATPSAAIHLRLTNRSDAPITVAVRDFMLPFGNFAVRPEVLELGPGETKEVEPMSAPAGGELSEIVARLSLRSATGAEEHRITLRPVPRSERERAPDVRSSPQ